MRSIYITTVHLRTGGGVRTSAHGLADPGDLVQNSTLHLPHSPHQGSTRRSQRWRTVGRAGEHWWARGCIWRRSRMTALDSRCGSGSVSVFTAEGFSCWAAQHPGAVLRRRAAGLHRPTELRLYDPRREPASGLGAGRGGGFRLLRLPDAPGTRSVFSRLFHEFERAWFCRRTRRTSRRAQGSGSTRARRRCGPQRAMPSTAARTASVLGLRSALHIPSSQCHAVMGIISNPACWFSLAQVAARRGGACVALRARGPGVDGGEDEALPDR